MHGYDPSAWAGFFTAVTAAAAALTGLLFVAVSINLENILGDSTKVPVTDPATSGATPSAVTPAAATRAAAIPAAAIPAAAIPAAATPAATTPGDADGASMLPARAAETLATLLFVVITSALALVPQDVELLGAEILVIALPLTVITTRNQLRFRRKNPNSPLLWSVSRMTASGLALAPGTIAGISLAAHWGGGLYWLAPTALCGIAGAVYSAWVLLVEIVR
jgi:hypothetical protein